MSLSAKAPVLQTLSADTLNHLQNRLNLNLKVNVLLDYDVCEQTFAISVWERVNNYCKVEQTKEYYAPVDFILTSLTDPNKKLHLELKSRDAIHEKYDTFMIGTKKIQNIKKDNLIPSLLIWSFNKKTANLEFSIANSIYFIEYHEDMLDLPSYKINGSDVNYIPKNKTTKTFEKLIEYIETFFNQSNDC
jgi:hypothetical protein